MGSNGDVSTIPSDRPRWRSIVLRPAVVALLLLSELALIAGIVDLTVLSSRHAGFVKLGAQDSKPTLLGLQSSVSHSRSLLWTTLPAVVLTLYRLFREAVVSAFVVETPFIELNKSSAARRTKVRKSVYVDYRTSFSIIAWYEALKNNHTFLGLCLLFSFVVSLALVPLAGGLFAEGQEKLVSNVTVNVLSTFTPHANITAANYGLMFDAISASWINAAPYPPGTDGFYPLPSIEPAQAFQNYTVSSHAETSQLSLDCRVVDDATITTVNRSNSIIETTFSATDRNCAISGDSLQTDKGKGFEYLKSITEQECPDWAGRTRLMLFHVKKSNSDTTVNTTLISCIPSYWAVNGTVETTRITGYKGRIVETPLFAREQSRSIKELPPLTRRTFETWVLTVKTISLSTGVVTAERLTELIARYIDSRSLDLSANSIIDAVNVIYPALYTMLCVSYYFPTLPEPIRQDGTLTLSENRLHVVIPAAIAMLVILVMLVIETLYLIIYLHRHPSILAEEPIGLVGAANLLHDSNIHCLIASSHNDTSFDGRLRRPSMHIGTNDKRSRTLYTDDHLRDRDCWVERDEVSGRLKIIVETKHEDDGCAKLLHPHSFPEYRPDPTVRAEKHQHVSVRAHSTSVSSIHSSEPEVSRAGRSDDAVASTRPIQHNTHPQNLFHYRPAADLWIEK